MAILARSARAETGRCGRDHGPTGCPGFPTGSTPSVDGASSFAIARFTERFQGQALHLRHRMEPSSNHR
ncbi:MAG TPA: hypothetical protein VE983_08020 [Solirubrobacteraceae bacterium]|nr:hypothetical protein [Solirubrobacteraceae bacterium]